MMTLNLDQKSAQSAQQIVIEAQKDGLPKEIENLITKALGVLQEQGVYACMLFLFSRTGKESNMAPHIRTQLYQLLGHLPMFNEQCEKKMPKAGTISKDTLSFYSECVCNDLDTLLLVKDLYEQTLIYARYGAKAAGNELAAI